MDDTTNALIRSGLDSMTLGCFERSIHPQTFITTVRLLLRFCYGGTHVILCLVVNEYQGHTTRRHPAVLNPWCHRCPLVQFHIRPFLPKGIEIELTSKSWFGSENEAAGATPTCRCSGVVVAWQTHTLAARRLQFARDGSGHARPSRRA